MPEEVWGPWIMHDGRGVPVPIGTVVNGVHFSGICKTWAVGNRVSNLTGQVMGKFWTWPYDGAKHSRWCWAVPGNEVEKSNWVICYRVRQFRAMEGLKQIAERPEKIGISETVR